MVSKAFLRRPIKAARVFKSFNPCIHSPPFVDLQASGAMNWYRNIRQGIENNLFRLKPRFDGLPVDRAGDHYSWHDTPRKIKQGREIAIRAIEEKRRFKRSGLRL
jgi:hypothetical protein